MYTTIGFLVGLFIGVGVMVRPLMRYAAEMHQYKGVLEANVYERQLWQVECIKYATIIGALQQSGALTSEAMDAADTTEWPDELKEAD